MLARMDRTFPCGAAPRPRLYRGETSQFTQPGSTAGQAHRAGGTGRSENLGNSSSASAACSSPKSSSSVPRFAVGPDATASATSFPTHLERESPSSTDRCLASRQSASSSLIVTFTVARLHGCTTMSPLSQPPPSPSLQVAQSLSPHYPSISGEQALFFLYVRPTCCLSPVSFPSPTFPPATRYLALLPPSSCRMPPTFCFAAPTRHQSLAAELARQLPAATS